MKIRMSIAISIMFALVAVTGANVMADQGFVEDEKAKQERMERFNTRMQQLQDAEGSGYKSTAKPKSEAELEDGSQHMPPEFMDPGLRKGQ